MKSKEVFVDLQNTLDAIHAKVNADIEAGRISVAQLFSDHYKPIDGTNPRKYNTDSDGYFDQILPPLIDPPVAKTDGVVYLIPLDRSGYCPTHNEAFRQPLDTGEIMQDLSMPLYFAGRHWGGLRVGFAFG